MNTAHESHELREMLESCRTRPFTWADASNTPPSVLFAGSSLQSTASGRIAGFARIRAKIPIRSSGCEGFSDHFSWQPRRRAYLLEELRLSHSHLTPLHSSMLEIGYFTLLLGCRVSYSSYTVHLGYVSVKFRIGIMFTAALTLHQIAFTLRP